MVALDNPTHAMWDKGAIFLTPQGTNIQLIKISEVYFTSFDLHVGYAHPLRVPELIQSTKVIVQTTVCILKEGSLVNVAWRQGFCNPWAIYLTVRQLIVRIGKECEECIGLQGTMQLPPLSWTPISFLLKLWTLSPVSIVYLSPLSFLTSYPPLPTFPPTLHLSSNLMQPVYRCYLLLLMCIFTGQSATRGLVGTLIFLCQNTKTPTMLGGLLLTTKTTTSFPSQECLCFSPQRPNANPIRDTLFSHPVGNAFISPPWLRPLPPVRNTYFSSPHLLMLRSFGDAFLHVQRLPKTKPNFVPVIFYDVCYRPVRICGWFTDWS